MGHTPGPWDKHILQRLTCGCVIMRSTSRAGGAYLVHCDLHTAAPALLAACEHMANAGRFYKFNRDRIKYTCLACGASGDIPRSIQHEEWCIIKEALAAIVQAKGVGEVSE